MCVHCASLMYVWIVCSWVGYLWFVNDGRLCDVTAKRLDIVVCRDGWMSSQFLKHL